MMKRQFQEDLEEMFRLIIESDSLALARFADGEASVLKNTTVGNKDGWLYKKDRNLVFRRDLRRSLLCVEQNYLYGISCTCCDKVNHEFFLKSVRAPLEQLTFSNLWVNANYRLFKERFLPVVRESKKPVVICSGSKAQISELERDIIIRDFIPIPGNCVDYWEKNRTQIRGLMDLKASQYSNTVFLFAAGPLSEILIHEMWQANPRNIYLDIGSTLDPILFRRRSRAYHNDDDTFVNRVCVW
ncbi:MAG TPA: hypothetical protein VGR01_00760 [Burkholderiales bacterium]|jgi:hypothetical protein|nr:hypothetical protein [Burkholderiales bacterium]